MTGDGYQDGVGGISADGRHVVFNDYTALAGAEPFPTVEWNAIPPH